VKAAIVRERGHAPEYGDFPDPVAGPGEVLVRVEAVPVNPLTISRAAGVHYSADVPPPFVPGVDGVGRTPEGRRGYFDFPRPPFGAMAELAPVTVDRLVELPDGVDARAFAAAALPGRSCWIPLTRRARVSPGDGVLIHGATGAAGTIAVQVARHLGAGRVVATGRNPVELERLRAIGATDLVRNDADPERFRAEIRSVAAEAKVSIVLDYLWGPTSETLIAALGGPGGPRGTGRIRYIEIGSIAGPSISLPSAPLRSSGVEILGHGIGSSTPEEERAAFREFLDAFASSRFRLDTEVHPLSEITALWGRTGGAHRLVFAVP